jgi:uncharacterized membrane protein YfcA
MKFRLLLLLLLLLVTLSLLTANAYKERDFFAKQLFEDIFGPVGPLLGVLVVLSVLLGNLADLKALFPQVLDRMFSSDKVPASAKIAQEAPESISAARSRRTAAVRAQSRWLRDYAIALLAGVLTGIIFLGMYVWLDFGPPDEVSERRVQQLCGITIDSSRIITTYPPIQGLLLQFIVAGLIVGAAIGAFLGSWIDRMDRLATRRGLSLLSNQYVGCITFGLFWGALLGAFGNTYFFGQSDGRPFFRLSSAVFAAHVSVCLFVILWAIVNRDLLRAGAAVDMTKAVTLTFLATFVFKSLDAAGGLSGAVYCDMYSAWDTDSNTIKPGLRTWLIAAAYGALIGTLVMWVVAGYRRVRRSVRTIRLAHRK